MLDGVTVIESKAQKDEIILEGNDVQNVSQSGISYYVCIFSCTSITQSLCSCIDSGCLSRSEQGYSKGPLLKRELSSINFHSLLFDSSWMGYVSDVHLYIIDSAVCLVF
jgi:hypothetical protein